jgi:hypothetical protein
VRRGAALALAQHFLHAGGRGAPAGPVRAAERGCVGQLQAMLGDGGGDDHYNRFYAALAVEMWECLVDSRQPPCGWRLSAVSALRARLEHPPAAAM